MICTVTLNPALDCYLTPRQLVPGQENRYEELRLLPGGKGVNVSLLLSGLGARTLAIGIAAGFTGQELCAMLDQAGCPHDFFTLSQGLTRLNLKLLPPGGPETGLNGTGPALAGEDLDRMEQRLAAALRPGDILVLSGSLPAGLPADAYVRLAKTAPPGVVVVLDASGPALQEGLAVRPFLVKPNRQELEELAGQPLPEERDLLRWAERLQHMGPKNVLVSLGGQGALLLTEQGQTLRRQALPGKEVSSVGAGDSMVAGFLYGWESTRSLSDALDWGLAAGAATAFTQGIASADAVKELYRQSFASPAC